MDVHGRLLLSLAIVTQLVTRVSLVLKKMLKIVDFAVAPLRVTSAGVV